MESAQLALVQKVHCLCHLNRDLQLVKERILRASLPEEHLREGSFTGKLRCDTVSVHFAGDLSREAPHEGQDARVGQLEPVDTVIKGELSLECLHGSPPVLLHCHFSLVEGATEDS